MLSDTINSRYVQTLCVIQGNGRGCTLSVFELDMCSRLFVTSALQQLHLPHRDRYLSGAI